MEILILVDYRNQFWLKAAYKEANFDLKLLKSSFQELGCNVEIKAFSDVRFDGKLYSNTIVVYQSAEDEGLLYKSYIEDILLGLKLAGATLIPDFHLFRAHHNKVFMEILRDISSLEELKNIRSRWFGTYEEYLYNSSPFQDKPVVFKLSDGAQSKNVRLLKSKRDKRRIPKRLSRSFDFYWWLVNRIKPFLKKRYPDYRKKSDHRRKFIVQNSISGLDGDFKVLVFYDKYYVLHRKIRKNDFRASGSGLFTFERELPSGLLDFAKKIFEYFEVPFISLDIACKGTRFFLLEFQFVSFGTYTLEKSNFYFVQEDGRWEIVNENSVLEEEFARSIFRYANHRYSADA